MVWASPSLVLEAFCKEDRASTNHLLTVTCSGEPHPALLVQSKNYIKNTLLPKLVIAHMILQTIVAKSHVHMGTLSCVLQNTSTQILNIPNHPKSVLTNKLPVVLRSCGSKLPKHRMEKTMNAYCKYVEFMMFRIRLFICFSDIYTYTGYMILLYSYVSSDLVKTITHLTWLKQYKLNIGLPRSRFGAERA